MHIHKTRARETGEDQIQCLSSIWEFSVGQSENVVGRL